MELDFKTVKALSSPTRVKILSQVLDKDATPTQLSRDIGKSKSTVSAHLTKLHKAGLLEKDKEDGRKRVVYSPTRKAKAIVKGKERKVRFSITSSAFSMAAGLALLGSNALGYFQQKTTADQAMMMTQESADTAAGSTSSLASLSPDILLFIGAGLIGVSLLGFAYGITVNKLSG